MATRTISFKIKSNAALVSKQVDRVKKAHDKYEAELNKLKKMSVKIKFLKPTSTDLAIP